VRDNYSRVSIYFQDESRFGLITQNGKMLTSKGVKPICTFQQSYKYKWLYGLFSAETGDNFMLEFPTCDSDCFQVFLDLFSQRRPNELLVTVLDNASIHKTQKLVVPSNVKMIFLPPYSPELNPAEKIWQKFKRAFSNKLFDNIEQMDEFISELARSLDNIEVMNTCACSYIQRE
jgi:transposase